MTPVEQYEAACTALSHVEYRFRLARRGCEVCGPKLQALQAEKQRIDSAVRKAKDAAGLHRTTPPSMQDSFMDVARETLTAAQFKLIWNLAHERARNST
jgi:hypothetical protein